MGCGHRSQARPASSPPGSLCPRATPPPAPRQADRPAAHRLVRADGVHLRPEHHRREDEEEQPLEAQQDEQDHRGGRREVAALWSEGQVGSGPWPPPSAPRAPALPQAPRLRPPGLGEDPAAHTRPHQHSRRESRATGRALPWPPLPHTPVPAHCLCSGPSGPPVSLCPAQSLPTGAPRKNSGPRHEAWRHQRQTLVSSESTTRVAQWGPRPTLAWRVSGPPPFQALPPPRPYLLRGEKRRRVWRVPRRLWDLKLTGAGTTVLPPPSRPKVGVEPAGSGPQEHLHLGDSQAPRAE